LADRKYIKLILKKFEITTSCQGTTDYLEVLGHIMDAMVQTFAIK
jgi:hypothetical protein